MSSPLETSKEKLVRYLSQDEEKAVRDKLQELLSKETEPALKKYWLRPVSSTETEDREALEELLKQKAVMESKKNSGTFLLRAGTFALAFFVIAGLSFQGSEMASHASLSTVASAGGTQVYQEGFQIVEERRKVVGNLKDEVLFVDLIVSPMKEKPDEKILGWVLPYMDGFSKMRFRMFFKDSTEKPFVDGFASNEADPLLQGFPRQKKLDSRIYMGYQFSSLPEQKSK